MLKVAVVLELGGVSRVVPYVDRLAQRRHQADDGAVDGEPGVSKYFR